MPSHPPQQWFEMKDVRQRRLTNAVWIPLRQSETMNKQGDFKTVESREEVICVGSVAIAKDFRAVGDTWGWMDIGRIHDPGPYAFNDGRYMAYFIYKYRWPRICPSGRFSSNNQKEFS